MSESQRDWIGEVLNGRYRVRRYLGGGGIADVYMATDTNLADEVCSISYKDRNGKYMGQWGVTLPKT